MSPNIPHVDLHTLQPGTASFTAFLDALQHWGFFHLHGHGVDVELIKAVRAQAQCFFQAPAATKAGIARTADNPWGYYDQERTKNRVDAKQIFDVGPSEGARRPQWPQELPDFEPVMERWSTACHQLCLHLLEALSQALNMPPQTLCGDFEPDHSSFLRLNYYPMIADAAAADTPLLPDSGRLGIHHHTDAGALTVLLQDSVAGLQVAHEGSWTVVEPQADSLVINIGDIAQVWSNDAYPAVLHRVLASVATPRYSAAYFFNPGYACRYAPVAGMVSAARPARYREVHWGAFRSGRTAGDYADYGAEIQISDFRIPD
ncbi:MAG: isopenicillin N synthase family dioxygenase [Pseudomonadales bacterium]